MNDERKEVFLTALQNLLPSVSRMSYAQLEKKIGREKLEEAVDCTWDYLEYACADPLKNNERAALVYKVLICLRDWMATQQIPCTLGTVVKNFHLIPFAVDQAFPYYASAGLLKFVVCPVAAVTVAE